MLGNGIQLVGVHGVPRSGTSWVGQIFNSHPNVAYRYQPFFSYAFRDKIDDTASASSMRQLFADLLHSEDDFVHQKGPARLARHLPEFQKQEATRLIYKEVRFHHLMRPILERLPEARIIGIVRDPRAVLASWFQAPREFESTWDPQAEWRLAKKKNRGLLENWYGFEKWKQFVRFLLELRSDFPGRLMIARYEDIVLDARNVVHALMQFADLNVQPQTVDFVTDSVSRDDGDPYGVYRQSASRLFAWRNDLAINIQNDVLADLQGSELEAFLHEQ